MSDPAGKTVDATYDVLIVGAGAAGLATAIFAARSNPRLRIAALDGARKLGAKILVSGGGRCNVTNRNVTPEDYNGTSRRSIARVLAAFSPADAREFFEALGVGLKVEPTGKLFPVTNQARTVLDALLAEAHRRNIALLTGHRVSEIEAVRCDDARFRVHARGGDAAPGQSFAARRIVVCTGGLSLPKTGSDGFGYELVKSLGHSVTTTTPALAPLVLEGDTHTQLAGVTHTPQLCVRIEGEKPLFVTRSMLWTHFGVSGPAAMDVSRHWLQARATGRQCTITANFLTNHDHWSVDAAQAMLRERAEREPRARLRSVMPAEIPARLADLLLREAGIPHDTQLAQLPRDARRKLAALLAEFPLRVRGSRGYNYAEVTAGGVPLTEIDTATMESRICPGLYLVGEILDVDGRIGGFNFQWAWSGGFVAGRALAQE